MKTFYFILCVLGTVLPLMPFISWVEDNGLAPNLLIGEIVDSRISLFAWLDLLISSIALIGFAHYERRRIQMDSVFLPIFATLTVGLSLGLPLFFLLRERHLEKINL